MKINLSTKNDIEIGDLVIYENKKCLLLYNDIDCYGNDFRYNLMDLETNKIIEAFDTLETEQLHSTLLYKSKDLELNIKI